ncbi:hypothetical protein NQ317_015884 [Molorchus minor]|uniref:C2H2-type domain-containing protein n=1 Tax=Molorchus minor TaxID=1323400 RepID=A0ABQ9J1A1_9CUCU|nr:hypothetical protein NQ317_015884 [Molorchus minor]
MSVKCEMCGLIFTQQRNLNRHYKNVHKATSILSYDFETFINVLMDELREHLKTSHNYEIIQEIHTFQSFQGVAFNVWLNDINKDCNSQYSLMKKATNKAEGSTTFYYYCNRSGILYFTNCKGCMTMHLLREESRKSQETQIKKCRVHVQHENDSISVDMWVEEYKRSSFVYYKRQGEDHDILSQEHLLETYGNKIICVDSTHGLNSYDFELTTVLVVDEYGEGLPGGEFTFPCLFQTRTFFKSTWKIRNKYTYLIYIQVNSFLKERRNTFWDICRPVGIAFGVLTNKTFKMFHDLTGNTKSNVKTSLLTLCAATRRSKARCES